MVHSGLQREALSLARSVFRAIRRKPVEAQPALRSAARDAFDASSRVDRNNFARVEHLLRQGKKKLELLQSESVVGVQGRSPPQ